jgi:hypothetical protein
MSAYVNSDILQAIGNAGLDAAGAGFVGPIWDLFFPQDDGFSDKQLAQLSELLQQMLNSQSYQEYYDNFQALGYDISEYINNPGNETLDEILINSQSTMLGILDFGGYATTRVYIAASALHILALRLSLDAASPDNKPGAKLNIGLAAVATLSNLIALEASYATNSWPEYVALRQAWGWGNADIVPSDAITAFGADYPSQIATLIQLVMQYAPSEVTNLTTVPYEIRLAPYDSQNTPMVWDANDGEGNVIVAFKCLAVPQTIPGDFFPISDLATENYSLLPTNLPTQVAYIAARSATLTQPDGYGFVFDDTDSDASTDYSGFYTVPQSVGSFSAASDNANYPDNSSIIRVCEPQYYCSVSSGDQLWSVSWNETGSFWQHPQFGAFGAYVIVRGYDSSTVTGLTTDAVTGFVFPVVMGQPVQLSGAVDTLSYVCVLQRTLLGIVSWSTDFDYGTIDQTGTITFSESESVYSVGCNVYALAPGGLFTFYCSIYYQPQSNGSAIITITT